jgi:hypothetical protein
MSITLFCERTFTLISVDPASVMYEEDCRLLNDLAKGLHADIQKDPESLAKIWDVAKILRAHFGDRAYIDIEKPMQVGVGYLVHAIRSSNAPPEIRYE